MGLYKHLTKLWRKKSKEEKAIEKARLIEWRKQPSVIRVDKPTRVDKARRLGWNWLITDTYDNPASSNSLISCGFKLYDPNVPWGTKGALYWRKKL